VKKKILYLVHRIPYPPNKGDKIRSFNILKYLSSDYEVHLAAFVDDPNDWQYLSALDDYCVDSYVAPLKPLRSKLRSLPALLGDRPMSVPYYADAGMRVWIETQQRQHQFDAVLVFSSAMAQYVVGDMWAKVKRVVDFVDVDSDKWMQYSKSKSWPMNWLYRREADTLLAYDKAVAAEFDASLFVSAKEAELFCKLAPESAEKTSYFNNGVDTEFFSPAKQFDSPYADGSRTIVFTGAMDYWANVDAVVWFSSQILPTICQQHTNVKFYIVGSKPDEKVIALAANPNIVVTGSVEDMCPYLAHAAVAVAPMRIARGVQNKVLEAMAMERPTVVSPQGYEGINAEAGRELIVASEAHEWIDAVAGLLTNEAANGMGAAARQRVVQDYSWQGSLARLGQFL